MKNKKEKTNAVNLVKLGFIAIVLILLILLLTYFTPSLSTALNNSLSTTFNSTLSVEDVLPEATKQFAVSSSTLKENGLMPIKYTRDGDNLSPPLNWSGIPNETKSLVIIMYDPDAPSGVFYHWILYNIPKNINSIPEGIQKSPITPYGYQGINSYNTLGYDGPSPPKGSTHRYIFLVLALDTELALGPNAYYSQVLNSTKGHIIAYAELTCLYRKD
jgi:Raf kinase inhibitor-like YbhB/YbcL family protein